MKVDFISSFENFYLRLPSLNRELREIIVKILPPVVLISGILLTLAAIFEFLGTPILSAFTLGSGVGFIRDLLITNVLGVFQGLLMIFAFVPLINKKQKGWRLVFWSQILWIAATLLTLSPWVLLGVILFYPLFQVRSQYR